MSPNQKPNEPITKYNHFSLQKKCKTQKSNKIKWNEWSQQILVEISLQN